MEGQNKVKRLPSGVYSPRNAMFRGPYLQERRMSHDQLIKMNGSVAQDIMKSLERFWSDDVKDAFKRYQMMHRRGVLVYGPPGTGKSSMFMQIIEDFVAEREHGNIVFLDPDPSNVIDYVNYVRQVDKDTRFLVIFEEFEGKLGRWESELLSLLDGENSIDGIVYLAATNYLHMIPERFKNRPSRFADVLELGPPEADVRRIFITERMPKEDLEKINVDEWVDKTEGMVLDHIKDLFISVHCIGMDLDTAVTKLKGMMDLDSLGN
jgi:AAA+ superfamily predicted ATPase